MKHVKPSLPSCVFSSSLLFSSPLFSSVLSCCLALPLLLGDLLGATVGDGASVWCRAVTGSPVAAVVTLVKVKKLSVEASTTNAVSTNPPRRSTTAKKQDLSIFFVYCCRVERKPSWSSFCRSKTARNPSTSLLLVLNATSPPSPSKILPQYHGKSVLRHTYWNLMQCIFLLKGTADPFTKMSTQSNNNWILFRTFDLCHKYA